jgi:hypothetical protein
VFLQSGTGFVGGGSASGVGCTWQWGGGGTWHEVSSDPPNLYWHAMVFDAGRDTFVMFGGHFNGASYSDDTWVWTEPSVAASYTTYGSGCAGTLPQTPRLRAHPLWSSAPVLGGQFFALVDRVPAGVPIGGVLGLSDSVYGAVTLPLSLTAFGMTGCQLLASAEATILLGTASAAGEVNWVFTVPATPSLAGFQFFQQGIALAPGANPAGLVFTNGGHGVVGN